MAILMQIEELTKSVGDRILFEDVTFGLNEGDKIGIVAKNGSGKSTLLSILCRETEADSGSVTCRRDLKTGYLPQRPELDEDTPVIDLVTAGCHDALEAEAMLSKLGITDMQATLRGHSGGEKKKVALVKAFLSDPQVLVLDEPTNHLDVATIEWLEGMLRSARMALVMVTHDRYFLERVCNRIMEIDERHAYFYEGNYDKFLQKRSERIENQQATLAKIRNTLRREQDWMSRQPQARGGKAKYRIDKFYELKDASRQCRDDRAVTLGQTAAYIGSKIFEAHEVCKSFGDKCVLDKFDYVFARGEKVGIIGANGVGKSTFIRMLQGLVQPDSGYFEIGETVRFGYYSQDGISFDERKKVIDAVTEIAEDVKLNGIGISPMSFLQKFLFSPADQQKYIQVLSGGEKSRLYLATVLMRNPNFLILDEPTNDLDIVTLGILEEYLASFKGCAIVISHDRFFLDNVADHLFVFTGEGKVKDFPGTYIEYTQWKKERQAALQAEKAAQGGDSAKGGADTRVKKERARKLSFKERKELEGLEKELEGLNAEKATLEAGFSSPDASGDDIVKMTARYEEVKSLLDEKEMRWLELSEIEG